MISLDRGKIANFLVIPGQLPAELFLDLVDLSALAPDDDAERAILAALELQATPPTLDYIPAPQIGISQGRIYAGAYGGNTRKTYGVLGDEVNLAARLMAKAAIGQILVSQRMQQTLHKHAAPDHAPVYTVEEAQALRGEIPGVRKASW